MSARGSTSPSRSPARKMVDVRWLLLAAATLFTLQTGSCSPRIAGSEYVYRYSENGKTCIYASFDMSFDIYYKVKKQLHEEPSYHTLRLPNNKVVHINGSCGESESQLILSWANNSLKMKYEIAKGKWKLSSMTLVFNLTKQQFNLTKHRGLQSFHTNGSNMFSRTFKTDEYFYCRNCKTYEFGGYNDTICDSDCQPVCVMYKNKSYCSSIHMEKSVIFVGDPAKANKRLCLEDYIQLQEIIVPSAVGGVLALLLILIFLAYIIAYIRRRRREAKSQYEPVGDF